MKKIEKILKKQIRILKSSYTDILNAYRTTYIKSEIGETKFKKELIYKNIPCYLSIASVKASTKLDITSSVVNDYLIFTDREILFEDNDEIILEKYGVSYKGKASRTYIYDTHNETTFRVEERV